MIANNNDVLLSLDDIGYHTENKTLLSHICFKLHSRETVSLIGPNGAGKSTLVKLILGLISPSHGVIHRHYKHVGYVPQRFSVPTIMPLRVKDLLNQATKNRLSNEQRQFIFEHLSIKSLYHQQIHHLSGGETQRVLLARALLEKPELLILDEPMQGLDPETETWLYQFIDELPDFLQCAILIVSHDLHWVMKSSRRVICLNKHICCQGKPSQVAISPEFVQLFGYQAPYIHQHTHCDHQLEHHAHHSGNFL